MEAEIQPHRHLQARLLYFDKLCYQKCLTNLEKQMSVKEENCHKNCLAKVLNALELMHRINQQGGLDRAPFKSESGFWSQ
ncbi:hypothetical protein pb186bvf_010979 [Paramecium bursaria]